MQQPMLHNRRPHIDTIRQNKRSLKLPRRDTAVQINPIAALLTLPAQDHQLPVLDGDRDISFGKARNGQGYTIRVF